MCIRDSLHEVQDAWPADIEPAERAPLATLARAACPVHVLARRRGWSGLGRRRGRGHARHAGTVSAAVAATCANDRALRPQRPLYRAGPRSRRPRRCAWLADPLSLIHI